MIGSRAFAGISLINTPPLLLAPGDSARCTVLRAPQACTGVQETPDRCPQNDQVELSVDVELVWGPTVPTATSDAKDYTVTRCVRMIPYQTCVATYTRPGTGTDLTAVYCRVRVGLLNPVTAPTPSPGPGGYINGGNLESEVRVNLMTLRGDLPTGIVDVFDQ